MGLSLRNIGKKIGNAVGAVERQVNPFDHGATASHPAAPQPAQPVQPMPLPAIFQHGPVRGTTDFPGGKVGRVFNPVLPPPLQADDPFQRVISGSTPDQRGESTIFDHPMRFNNGPIAGAAPPPTPVMPRAKAYHAPPVPHWRLGGFGDKGTIQVPQNPFDHNTGFYNFTPRQMLTVDPRTGVPIQADTNVAPDWAKPRNMPYSRQQKLAPMYLRPTTPQQKIDRTARVV